MKALLLFKPLALIAFTFLAGLVAEADSLRYLGHSDQALMQMAQLIDSAKKSVDLTYYIVDPCAATTKVLFQKLRERAADGVKVRIVIDAYTHNADLQQNLRQSLLQNGIELRYFNKVRVSPEINYRTHAKIMIADGQRYITGGRNLADDYFGVQKDNFIDRDVYVVGNSAVKAQQDFNNFWQHSLVYTPNLSSTEKFQAFESTCLKQDQKTANVAAAVARETEATLSAAPVIECANVKFTFDDPQFWRYTPKMAYEPEARNQFEYNEEKLHLKETTKEVMSLIQETQQFLVMENWGYIPYLTMDWAIKSLRAKNLPITIVTNKTTDVGGSVDVLNRYYSGRDNVGSQKIYGLSREGSMTSAWSQTPEGAKWMIHSKVFVSDAHRVGITSFNIDSRSYHTNIETGLFVQNCPQLANHVLAETKTLVSHHEADKSCTSCQHSPESPILDTVKAWLSQELL